VLLRLRKLRSKLWDMSSTRRFRRAPDSGADVKALREKFGGLSQEQFAEDFGVTVSTVRNWEQRRAAPRGPAGVLLTVIAREPAAVKRALRSR
jgi:putative transcriptional regulator